MFTFDDSPMLYLALGNLFIISTGILSVLFYSKEFRGKIHTTVAIGLCILLLVMLRLPVIVFNDVLNPDENMFLAGAMTLSQNPIYWEAVDGCTSGPLNFYIITIFCDTFGQPYDYISARIVGIILLAGSIIFNFFALKKIFSLKIAFASIFPAVAFLGTTRNYDFVHYSSEHLPIFLLSILCYLYAKMTSEPKINSLTLFLTGLIAGLLTLTKLQAVPIAFCLTLVIYWLVYNRYKKQFAKPALWLSAGGMSVLLLVFIWAMYFGVAEKIWFYYLKNNLSYGNKTNVLASIYYSLFDSVNIFIRVIIVSFIGFSVYYLALKQQYKLTLIGGFVVVFLLSTIVAVYKTGYIFHHYLLFLIFPTIFLYAVFLHELSNSSGHAIQKFTVSVITIIILYKIVPYPLKNQFISANIPQRPLAVSVTSKEITKYLRTNEPLVIWGDDGRLYLETKVTQGITWGNTHWGMYSDSLQRHFEKEFVKKITKKKLPVFVDTHPTKGTFMTRDKLGYETRPVLKQLIDSKYRLVGEFDEKRVFVRADRYDEITAQSGKTKLTSP